MLIDGSDETLLKAVKEYLDEVTTLHAFKRFVNSFLAKWEPKWQDA